MYELFTFQMTGINMMWHEYLQSKEYTMFRILQIKGYLINLDTTDCHPKYD